MMKKNIRTIILLLGFAVMFGACDIIEAPYNEKPIGPPPDTTKYVRNVLLEEYTGHRCGNCPRAAKVAESLHELYGDRVIIMRVHAGPYANTKGFYSYDFRTPEGNEFDVFFGNSQAGNPNGMVSRYGYSNNHILPEAKWESSISDLLDDDPRLSIEIEAVVDTSSKKITIDYKIKYLMDGSGDDNLCLFILEDNIINYQTDYSKDPTDIPDYNHSHVLRGSINGTWGEPLNAQGISEGDEFEDTVNYTIPQDKDWVPSELSILAFVHDNGGSYEVYQVVVEHVKIK